MASTDVTIATSTAVAVVTSMRVTTTILMVRRVNDVPISKRTKVTPFFILY